ncbi:AsmA family protein [Candidatus Brocadiaceae bacterium B188]|nr:DUF748 domain-containing protein [Candidatus Brocadia sapporoensis]QQR67672.1 MAG: DUF748 domain-containing protein [Candidatus Brocadia sp.]TWU52502.1 AsmA family protein [Candidatus Brocadiaceae bacterium B188]
MLHIKSYFRVGRTLALWSWPSRITAIVSILIALYAGIGFLALPPLVKTRLIKTLSERTGRNVELNRLRINPFSLSTTLQKLSIYDPDGSRFIGFDELYINFQTSSLFRWTYTFAQLRLTAPYICVKIRKDKTFNFQDLLPSTNDKSKTQQRSLVPLLIQRLIIDHGQTIFEDYSRTTPFREEINDVSISFQNFTTRPNREGLYEFEAITGHGEALKYRGNISMSPLYSKGRLELSGIKLRSLWSYLQDQLHFEITRGELDISGDYEFDATGETPDILVQQGKIDVRSLTVAEKGGDEEIIALPHLTMSGTDIDFRKKSVKVNHVQSGSSTINVVRDEGGSMNLLALFQPKTDKGEDKSLPSEPNLSSGWVFSIGKIEIADYALHMTDHSTKPAANLDLSPINMKLEDVQIGAPGLARIELQAGFNQTGMITIAGNGAIDHPAVDLNVELSKVPIKPFQPYCERYARLVIEDGAVTTNGHINYSQADGSPDIHFQGDIAIESARIADPILAGDILRCERLDLKQVQYQNSPDLLTINEIIARGLYTDIIIGPDRTANVQHILVSAEPSPEKSESRGAAAHRLSVQIGQVSVTDSSMNFADHSLSPRFATGIQDLNGTIKGLSSEQLARAEIDLKGYVDKYAPVTIQGKINPLSDQAFTDINMNFQGIELTTFSSYSGKFAGYKIEKGKLTLELHYKLSEKILIGENHIVMNQFTLGEKVDGPDVTKLPVRLAIAILKDSRGIIDINLPVRGDLNDPKFRFGPLILKTLVNLVVKAATAPFKMLGALVGSEGEELSFVSFAPGSDSLSQEQQTKLSRLAKALASRPQLRLDLRGTAAEAADRQAIAEQAIMASIRAQKDAASEGTLTEEDQKRLHKLYRETFKKDDPRNLVSPTDAQGIKLPRDAYKAAVAEAARKRLIEKYPVSEDDLRTLARKRAESIKDFMVHQGGIAEPRVFLLDVDTKASALNGEIRMPLALDAH